MRLYLLCLHSLYRGCGRHHSLSVQIETFAVSGFEPTHAALPRPQAESAVFSSSGICGLLGLPPFAVGKHLHFWRSRRNGIGLHVPLIRATCTINLIHPCSGLCCRVRSLFESTFLLIRPMFSYSSPSAVGEQSIGSRGTRKNDYP